MKNAYDSLADIISGKRVEISQEPALPYNLRYLDFAAAYGNVELASQLISREQDAAAKKGNLDALSYAIEHNQIDVIKAWIGLGIFSANEVLKEAVLRSSISVVDYALTLDGIEINKLFDDQTKSTVLDLAFKKSDPNIVSALITMRAKCNHLPNATYIIGKGCEALRVLLKTDDILLRRTIREKGVGKRDENDDEYIARYNASIQKLFNSTLEYYACARDELLAKKQAINILLNSKYADKIKINASHLASQYIDMEILRLLLDKISLQDAAHFTFFKNWLAESHLKLVRNIVSYRSEIQKMRSVGTGSSLLILLTGISVMEKHKASIKASTAFGVQLSLTISILTFSTYFISTALYHSYVLMPKAINQIKAINVESSKVVEEKKEVEVLDAQEEKAFISACFRGDFEYVYKALESNQRLENSRTIAGLRGPHIAVLIGNVELLNLFSANAQQMALDDHGHTPFYHAVSKAFQKDGMIDYLFGKVLQPTQLDKHRNTPLHIAVASGNIEIVKRALDLHGDDIVRTYVASHSPLSLAVDANNPEIIEAVFRKSVELVKPDLFDWPKLTDHEICNTLRALCSQQDLTVFKSCLKMCEDRANDLQTELLTVLNFAISRKSYDAVEAILSAKLIYKNYKPQYGLSPLHQVMDVIGSDVFDEDKQKILVTLIKSETQDLNEKDKGGYDWLQRMRYLSYVSADNVSIRNFLDKYGCKKYEQYKNGATIIMMASSCMLFNMAISKPLSIILSFSVGFVTHQFYYKFIMKPSVENNIFSEEIRHI